MAPAPRSRGGRIVTLTSDVGSAYAAQMKAALISSGVDPGRIVDLAHDLTPHDIDEAAFLLREMARAFPSNSVHVAVVDPGVGGQRQPLAITTRAGPILVGPDNGVLMPLARELGLERAYRIDASKLGRPTRVGNTFDGRDLFAPAAATLANGRRAASLGAPTTAKAYAIPEPTSSPTGIRGKVIHRDRFGNLVTNIPTGGLARGVLRVELTLGRARRRPAPFVTSYESLGRGALGLLGSSFGLLEVAVGEGRASDLLRAGVGNPVVLAWRRRSATRSEKANTARPRKQR
ncbi:MAG TPA: SAM-dependent chlorinase/fluorinase [Thermoplasmata archaeon]|nr:SAM-dependent chlorinase/fluorinase [Thermoplasmata archaeon]